MTTKWLALAHVAVVVGGLGAGCATVGGGSDSTEQDVAGTSYVNLVDFNSSAYQDPWSDLQGQLAGEFNAVCGDTFCEGDYANLTPLTLMCSVSAKAGIVHDCAWSFGGSIAVVNDTSAAIGVDAPTFECHFHPKATTAGKFVTFLQTATDLHAPLPGTSSSIYDELVDCFQHPIGHTAVTPPQDATAIYVDADDYYVSAASIAKWNAAKAALKLGFDNICGDTFCGSDYGDLQSLTIACAVTKSSGNVKGCDWVFAGSIVELDGSANAAPHSKSWTCPIAMKGTLPQLITTLTATLPPGSPGPIDRALPGMTSSAYDAIGTSCLP